MLDPNTIVIVSGLPRSGTSMMMQMLEAGGLDILTDQFRTADEDNLKGYYEFEKVKTLKTDQSWLPEAQGKVVKLISELLKHLPDTYTYKIIFMQRDLKEVLASQEQMLIRRGVPAAGQVSDEQMARIFQKHLEETKKWLSEHPFTSTLYVNHKEVLTRPAEQAKRINTFLSNILNVQRMASVIDPSLYRQRQ